MVASAKKNTTRRPTKNTRQPSLASAKKPTASKRKPAAKKPATKKSVAKKTSVKRPPARARKPAARKKPAVRQFQLPLGRGRQVSVSISVSKPAPKKKPVAKKQTAAQRKKTEAKRQIVKSLVMIAVGLAGSLYFGMQVFAGGPTVSPAAATPLITPYKAPTDTPSLPASDGIRLKIADIAVDAEITSVGKMTDGSLEVPADASKVGQYNFAPTPGEVGPAILVGHVDTIRGPAVFWRLRELQPGQLIEVNRKDGTVARFKVDRLQDYPQDAFPTAEVYGNLQHAGLRLITCGGNFNVLSQHYSHNTVVYASLVQ